MDKHEIFDLVKKTVMDTIGLEESEVIMEAHFINDLGCDSLGLSELIMRIEDKFNMRISDIEAEKLKHVQDVVNYILEHQKAI